MEKKPPFYAKTEEEMKIVFDPYRLRVIYIVDHSDEPLTVKQIAGILQQPANKVHYHVKKLVDFGYFKLVKTETINGIIAKYYTTAYSGPWFAPETRKLPGMTSHLRSTMSAMDQIASDFKNDIIAYTQILDKEGPDSKGMIMLDRIKLYMTHEEAIELVNNVLKLIGKYTEKDESKQSYTTVQAIARVK